MPRSPSRAALAETIAAIARRAAASSGTDPGLLEGYLEIVRDVRRTGRGLTRKERDDRRLLGRRAAENNVPLGTLVDVYLGATRLAWTDLPDTGTPRRHDVTAAVLRAANEAVGALAGGYDDEHRSAIRAEEALRREFIDDLLHGADPGRLAERAGGFGLYLVAHHVVAVLNGGNAFTDADDRTRSVADAVRGRLGGTGVLIATKEGLLVCVVQSTDSGAVLADVRAAVGHERPGTVGVGRPHPGPGGVARSYDEARTALELSSRLGVAADHLLGADLLVYQVLGRDRAAIVDLVETVLSPLQDARGGARPLLDTLTAYFRAGNATAAARDLHLSVRALTYRLARIHRLTGYDPSNPDHRYTVETAVLGARMLDWPEVTP
ncbi:helix-turn-helix domain-containing protein [Virgisporangium ochraceum]